MKVGDLIRDRRFPEDGYAIIVYIGDKRGKTPYKLYCINNENADWFAKNYVEKQCIVVNK